MRKFIKFLVATISLFLFISFLILTSVRFQVLNSDFLINTLRKGEIYEQSTKALKLTLQSNLRQRAEEASGKKLKDFTVGERSILEKQIGLIVDKVTTERVQDITENNIVAFTSYINGVEEGMYLYLPFNSWDLPSQFFPEDELVNFSERTDVDFLLNKYADGSKDIKNMTLVLKGLGDTIYKVWMGVGVAILVFVFIHFLLSKGFLKIKSTAYLFIKMGMVTTGISLMIKVVGDNLTKGSAYWREAQQIFIGGVVIPVVDQIVTLWLIMSVGLIVFGVIIIIARNLYLKAWTKKPEELLKI